MKGRSMAGIWPMRPGRAVPLTYPPYLGCAPLWPTGMFNGMIRIRTMYSFARNGLTQPLPPSFQGQRVRGAP